MGDPEHAVAGQLEPGITIAVPLEGGAAAVEGVAVELDDQSLLAPQSIHLEPFSRRVEAGQGEVGSSTQLQEPALELRARDRRWMNAGLNR
jgi:hypothetical protein